MVSMLSDGFQRCGRDLYHTLEPQSPSRLLPSSVMMATGVRRSPLKAFAFTMRTDEFGAVVIVR